MMGVDAGRFAPDIPITRAMVVQTFYNRYGRPSVAGLLNPFYDVAPGQWYTDAVIWAYHNGIIDGFGDGTFRPGNPVARAHLTILFDNYANILGVELPTLRVYQGFADDADVRSYARESIIRFYQSMLILGRPDGRFDPQGNVIRAEFAALLHRFLLIADLDDN